MRPITDVWNEVDGDHIFPEAIRRMITFGGAQFAMPINMGILDHVYYNKKTFDKLGIEPPTTWDEFEAACQKLEANKVQCLGNGQGFAWTFYNFYASILAVMGTDGYYGIARGTVAFDRPEMA